MASRMKPRLKSRALVYVPLCQGNHVAAALLDWIVAFSKIENSVQYKEPFYVYVESAYGPLGDPGPFKEYFGYKTGVDGNLEADLALLRAVVVPQLLPPATVTDEELWEALDLLEERCHVSWHLYSDERTPDAFIDIGSLFLNYFDNAVASFHYGYRIGEEEPLYNATRERRIVREQKSRAARIGQSASLTFEEWIETLLYFNGRCAFFADHPYEVLEHFIPVNCGGGTTVFNCIPACQACNAVKADRLPVDLGGARLREALPRIQAYLDERRELWLRKHS